MPFPPKTQESSKKVLEAGSSSKLTVPKPPRFPLSSPVSGDSAEKGRIFNDSKLETEDALENPFTDSDPGDTSGYDEFRLEKDMAELRWQAEKQNTGLGKPARVSSKRDRDSNTKKKARPGLNVVTNFAKSSKKVLTDHTKNRQLNTERPQVGEKAATGPKKIEIKPDLLANIAANPSRIIQSHHDQTRTSGNAKVGDKTYPSPAGQSESKPTSHIRNPTLDSLKRSDTKTTDVSPSARTVMIGIEEHDLDSAARDAGDTPKSITPITPSILITPAYSDDNWRTKSPGSGKHKIKRPTSSVYSQATAFASFDQALQDDAPPVPKLPDAARRDTLPTTNGLKGRPAVTTTPVEDNSAQALRPRATSDETKRGILRRSTDSPVSRPQSKGWWNLGLSPMLSRTGTLRNRGNPFEDDLTPPVPPISPSYANISKGLGLQEKDWESDFSPQTPRRNGTDSGRASTWSSWSDWENMRDGPDLSTMHAHEASKAAQQPSGPDHRLSTGPVVGGLAAEYFHASAHDLISPAPYFECQNHDCVAQLPKLESIHDLPLLGDTRGLQVEAPGQNKTNEKGSVGEADTDLKGITNGSKNSLTEVDFHSRSGSDSTFIDEEPSPSPTEPKAGKEGKGAPNGSDRAFSSNAEQSKSTKSPPVLSNTEIPKKPLPYPIDTPAAGPPISPAPVTPAFERSIVNTGGIPMSQVQHIEAPKPQTPPETVQMPAPRAPYARENSYDRPQQSTLTTRTPANAAPLPSPAFFAQDDHINGRGPPTRGSSMEEDRKPPSPASSTQPFARSRRNRGLEHNEKKDASEKKPGIFSRIKSFLPKKKSTQQSKRKKRLMYATIAIILFLIILTILLLALLLTRRGDNTPVETQWLNLTGYPPIPTGISTVARPDLTRDDSDCVFPKTMWSCSLPKEQQESVAPNDANQPNFRLEIRFKNGTVSNGTAVAQRRDPFTSDLFTPDPSPPSLAEQSFLGNTTDNTTAPFEGESTPFFISFLDPAQLPSSSQPSKRSAASEPDPAPQASSSSRSSSSLSSSTISSSSSSSPSSSSSSSSSSTSSLPSLPTALPPPSQLSLPNGTAQPATLLPLPTSQPLRLYDRGLPTEHYGFYTYFSRSIFLESSAPLNASTQDEGDVPGDDNGGATRDAAKVRCTWAQTRFKVQMWTKLGAGGAGAQLLGNHTGTGNSSTTSSSGGGGGGGKKGKGGKNSSANDFAPPGSFPYPMTLSLDRHGGNPEEKLLFCYEVDERGKIVGQGKVQEEFRGVGGQLVNPVPGLFSIGNGTGTGTGTDGGSDSDGGGFGGGFDIHAGGVDGGTGGCGCEWRNFQGAQGAGAAGGK